MKKETAEERKVRDTIQIQPQYSHRNCCDAYLLKYEGLYIMIIVKVVYSTYMNCEGLNVWMEGMFFIFIYANTEQDWSIQEGCKSTIKISYK